ncbi:MAG: LptA/OstA family protein [Oligoflexia bacterium]|nr:LptA/OstA family protein [Oligoflexia bacterium]
MNSCLKSVCLGTPLLTLALGMSLCWAQSTPPQPAPTHSIPFSDQLKLDSGKGPTYINSDSLSLNTKDRVFEYKGHVDVTHEEMNMKSDTLQGFYDDKNQIQKMIASTNVLITKADIKASSQHAIYERASDTVTLTENPQLEQNGSILSADLIRIFLADNRSVAEGTVRVTLAEKKADDGAEGPRAEKAAKGGDDKAKEQRGAAGRGSLKRLKNN